MFLTKLILAIFNSIDSIGIGLILGINNVKITNIARTILIVVSIIIVLAAIIIGSIIGNFFNSNITKFIGAIIFIIIGSILILKIFKKKKTKVNKINFNNLKIIDKKEAIYLSIILSIDSLNIGLGIGCIYKFSLVFPVLVSFLQVIFLTIGNEIGKYIKKDIKMPSYLFDLLIGILLIVIGIIKII